MKQRVPIFVLIIIIVIVGWMWQISQQRLDGPILCLNGKQIENSSSIEVKSAVDLFGIDKGPYVTQAMCGHRSAPADASMSDVLADYMTLKANVLYDKEAYLAWLRESTEPLADQLKDYLINVSAISLPADPVSVSRPRIVLERMAAIDVLGDLAGRSTRHGESARAALKEILLHENEIDAKPRLQRVIAAEKCDCLRYLVGLNDPASDFIVAEILQSNVLPEDLSRVAALNGLLQRGLQKHEVVDAYRALLGN